MSETAALNRILALLDQVGEARAGLAPNESQLYEELKAKYEAANPGQPGFEDETCLQVILRNIDVRKKLRGH